MFENVKIYILFFITQYTQSRTQRELFILKTQIQYISLFYRNLFNSLMIH